MTSASSRTASSAARRRRGNIVSDLVVAGGGPVGLATALGAARSGVRVSILEARDARSARAAAEAGDARATALSSETWNLLCSFGLERALRARAEAIHSLRVYEARLGHGACSPQLSIPSTAGEPMGRMVLNSDLLPLLQRAVADARGVRMYFGAEVSAWSPGCVETHDGRRFSARLVAAADGSRSRLRSLAGIRARCHTYDQIALVGLIGHTKPHAGVAYELFLPEGPLAFLPLRDGTADGGAHTSAFVWSLRRAQAHGLVSALQAQDETAREVLRETLAPLAGEALGTISISGRVQSWPLSLTRARSFAAARLVLVGDAARAIHPVAGQGLNLAFRDVAALCSHLNSWLAEDASAETIEREWNSARRLDSLALTAFTDGIVRLFGSSFPPAAGVRRLGLGAVARSDALRDVFLGAAGGAARAERAGVA